MANPSDIVEIRNETPLDISISGRRVLKPLEVAEYEPGDVDALTFAAPRLGGRFLTLALEAVPPAVTIDLATVARGQEPELLSADEFCDRVPLLRADPSSLRLLQVYNAYNETPHVAFVWLLDRTGGRQMGQIAPGDTWEHPYEPRLLWHFRTHSGLTLGVFFQSIQEWGRKEPARVKLTTEFLDAWQAYKQQPAQT